MIAKFNPTGTHTHKGFLKVRIDLYPSVGDKTYKIHYVDVVDKDGEPTGEKKLNPALCHFIKIDQNTTLASLGGIVRGIFNKATVDQLDDILSKPDTSQVRQVMKSKLGTGKKLPVEVDIAKLQARLNARFASLELV